MKKYVIKTTVEGCERMWDFCLTNEIAAHRVSLPVAPSTTSILYEIEMDDEIAVIFALQVYPINFV